MLIQKARRYIWAERPTLRAIRDFLKQAGTLFVLVLIVIGVTILTLYLESSIMGAAFKNPKDIMQSLRDSGLIGALGNIAVITGLVSFIISGTREAKKNSLYQAWIILDLAKGTETSYARIQALTDLNERGQRLDGLDAEKADLNEIILPKASLKGASLSHAKLNNSQMSNSQFTGATLVGARFENAKLMHCKFYGALMTEAIFGNAVLNYADFRQAIAHRADFTSARLEHSKFDFSQLHSATFKNANLRFAQFSGAILDSATFQNATLNNAVFENVSNLPKEEILKAKGWEHAFFDNGVKQELAEIQDSQRRNETS